MFRLVTGVSGLLSSVVHQLLMRSSSAVAVLTRNATTQTTQLFQAEWDKARPFEDIPGPKPLPLIGKCLEFLAIYRSVSDVCLQSVLKVCFADQSTRGLTDYCLPFMI